MTMLARARPRSCGGKPSSWAKSYGGRDSVVVDGNRAFGQRATAKGSVERGGRGSSERAFNHVGEGERSEVLAHVLADL